MGVSRILSRKISETAPLLRGLSMHNSIKHCVKCIHDSFPLIVILQETRVITRVGNAEA